MENIDNGYEIRNEDGHLIMYSDPDSFYATETCITSTINETEFYEEIRRLKRLMSKKYTYIRNKRRRK